MYAVVTLFVFMCLTATTHADHHQPCHSLNMTGVLSVTSCNGQTRAVGGYAYDSTAKKLRFKANDTLGLNATLTFDVLMFFEEGVFYEIDGKNQSCEKKSLQSVHHALDLPDDAKLLTPLVLGSSSIEGEGFKLNLWTGTLPETKAHYAMSVTTGCLPVSVLYLTESASLLISNLNVETEIKDPDLLTLPSFCEGEALEETPEGTVHSFYNLFI
ncbi:ependymin [Diretmus argenteus]